MKTDPKIIAKWANKKIDEIAEPGTRRKVVEDLADRCGRSVGTMYKYLEGIRKWPTKYLEIMAEYFGEDPPGGLPGRRNADDKREPPDNVVPFRTPIEGGGEDDGWISYPIVGVTHAGAFREPDELPQPNRPLVKGERDERFPNVTPMAWNCCDDSMNEHEIFVGTTVYGVDFQEAGGILENDMVVVVERKRGRMIERSIKLVAVYPDRIEFQPKSSDPVHKSFIYNDGRSDGDTEVRVLTIVTGTYRKW